MDCAQALRQRQAEVGVLFAPPRCAQPYDPPMPWLEQNLNRFVEAPALAPPEFEISPQEALALEQQLAAAAAAPLPEDDEEL